MTRFIARTKLNINDIKEVEEYKALIPENNQYEELKRAIKDQGFLFPVIVNKNGELLDGYTRLKIARELGITEIPAELYETGGREEELDIIASLNLKRRHLTKDELVLLIDKIHEMKKRLKKDNIDEQNRSTPATILPTDTDKISARQESREIKEELKRLVPDVQINEETIRKYLQIKKEAPWLVQYIGDEKKGKIGISKAYNIYLLLKEKNLLDLDKRIPKPELYKLITDKNGRKVLERDDLLQLILDHKMAVSQAINKIKTEEKLQRSKKKSRAKEDLEDEEELEEEAESTEGEDSESDEYPFVEEWAQAQKEEEAKQQLTPQFNVSVNSSTRQVTLEVANVLEELSRKGFIKLDFGTEVVIAKISGKYYAILLEALKSLERGSKQYKDLADFLVSNNLAVYDAEEDNYIISWRSLNCS
ncbi:ParB N-terminal domain-containing protein [Saccharolobus islandicus]|uniref:ParB domain protein nuclease n=1 Tax=Saccharolobus islandicus (strain L.D.8.5 / Lassen \|nr:ParB N-terminal domain-containing protein [Sulfolobus islandicus]ADB87235.1 ParB domain protein nuclease [Sulfolobus islandicus L.D.8.5]